MFVPSEASLAIKKKSPVLLEIDGGGGLDHRLRLPSPNEPTDYLTQGLLSVQGDSSEVMSLEVANSLAISVRDVYPLSYPALTCLEHFISSPKLNIVIDQAELRYKKISVWGRSRRLERLQQVVDIYVKSLEALCIGTGCRSLEDVSSLCD